VLVSASAPPTGLACCSARETRIAWPLAAYALSNVRRPSGPYLRELGARDDAGRASPGKPGSARPASSHIFLCDIGISSSEGLWETAAPILDGYAQAEGVSSPPTLSWPPLPRVL
jgi:hypothetical protein